MAENGDEEGLAPCSCILPISKPRDLNPRDAVPGSPSGLNPGGTAGREGREEGRQQDAAGFTHGHVMTGGSCLTFHPDAFPAAASSQAWELGPSQYRGLEAASQALSVWVSLAWDGAMGRMNGAGQDRRHLGMAVLCSLLTF